jgi:plasmid maintenance system antidote protein VapI
MGAKGPVTTATEMLRDAVRDRGWSEEELAWVLDLPVELAEHLMWEANITPTLALRLEAALEISARDWYAAAGMPLPDLWLLTEHMGGELAGIRWRRYRLSHDRRQGGG